MAMHHEFHGEVDEGTDASSGIEFTLFHGGSNTAYTLQSDEHLVITDFIIVTAAAGVVAIYSNADADGKRVVKGSVAAGGGISHHFVTPYFCLNGVVPKLFAPAGQANGTIHGFIQQ